jgi:hypothetical protein
MKRLIIICAILFFLIGGGVSAMRTLQLGPFAEDADAPASAKNNEPKPVEALPLFVEMDLLAVPILQGDRAVATVQIQLRLEASTAANEALIRKSLPRLSDAILRDLYGFLPRLLHRQATVDVNVVRERLEFIVGRVLGPGIAEAVLIQSMTDASAPRTPPPAPAGQSQAVQAAQPAPASQPARP